MAIYLKIEGIDGDVTARGYEQWINCSSLQWGCGRAISTITGSTKDRESSVPTISEVTVTKSMDESSPRIFQEVCSGRAQETKLHLVQTGPEQPETYMEYILTESLISGYSVNSGGETPSESVSMNFTKMEMKYTPWGADHTPGSPIPASYDITKASGS